RRRGRRRRRFGRRLFRRRRRWLERLFGSRRPGLAVGGSGLPLRLLLLGRGLLLRRLRGRLGAGLPVAGERIVAEDGLLGHHSLPAAAGTDAGSSARSGGGATPRKSRMVCRMSKRGRNPSSRRAFAPSAMHKNRKKSRKFGGESKICVIHSARDTG